jgi:peptide/nickel transport system substrate-binding protein
VLYTEFVVNVRSVEKLKRTYVVAAAIIVIAIIGLSLGYYYYTPTATPSTPKQYPTIVLGTTLDVAVNLDPGVDYNVGVLNTNYNVFDPLYEIPPGIFPEADLTPRLASGQPTVSADGLHWEIPLRHGVKFQDGTPFNATAVKYSFDRLKNLNSYSAWILDMVDSVDVVDQYTVRYNLKYPNAALEGALTMPVAAPVSPSAVERMGLEAFQQLPVGTGPFKYVEWQKGDHITLAPFEDYWNQSRVPKVRLVYKIFTDSAALKLALEKGDIDIAWDYIAVSDYSSLLSDPNLQHAAAAEDYIVWLTLNDGIPGSPLTDVRVRQAIEYSVDQNEISQKVYHGIYTPCENTPFQPGFYPKDSWLQYKPVDIAKAKELLTAAGHPNGIDVTLTFTPVSYGKEMPDVAALLQEQLGKAGIRVTLKSLEAATFIQGFRAGQYEMALGIMSPDYPDPDNVASFIAASTGSYAKRVRLNDTTIDQLVKDGVATTDSAQRAKIYGDLQDRLANLAVYVPLVHQDNYWFYRPSSVTGVQSYYFQMSPWWTLDKTSTT